MKTRLIQTILLIAVVTAPAVHAGSSMRETVGIDKYGAETIADFSTRLDRALDERKVDVAIIARTGRPQEDLPEGVRYTHVGIAVFEPVRTQDGEIHWVYSVYNLYQGAGGRPGRSHLVQDFTYDLCAGIAEPRIGVIVPSKRVQREMLKVLRSKLYSDLHNTSYNLIANPYNDDYDNCVTHTLKVMTAAVLGADDPSRIQAHINLHFKARPILLNPVLRIGVLLKEGIALDDHRGGPILTATFDTLQTYLDQQGELEEAFDFAL